MHGILTCGMGAAANAGQAMIEARTAAIAAALCCCHSLLLTCWAHAATAGGRTPRRTRLDARQHTVAASSMVAGLLICLLCAASHPWRFASVMLCSQVRAAAVNASAWSRNHVVCG